MSEEEDDDTHIGRIADSVFMEAKVEDVLMGYFNISEGEKKFNNKIGKTRLEQKKTQKSKRNLEIKRLSEKDHDELFEKKYNSKFEKIDETMGHIKSSIEEIKELKKQKALERQKAKEEKQIETPETRFSTKSDALPIQQVQQTQPTQVKTNSLVIPKMPDYKNMFKKYPF